MAQAQITQLAQARRENMINLHRSRLNERSGWAFSTSPACPTILTRVPDLKEISAVTVAIGLWNHVNVAQAMWRRGVDSNMLVYNACYDHFPSIADNISKSTAELPVPKSVAEYIDGYVRKIRSQIRDWVSYHRQAMMYSYGTDFLLYHHIPYFKWYPDGTINYGETARNLLNSRRLSDVEKYKFLCMYCLKDELMILAPLLLADNVVEFATISHPLIFYWNHYFTNTLDKIPFTPFASLDNYMFQLQGVNNWWAKEYFFDRLNSEEKVQGAIALIDKLGVWYQKLILLKLNETERINLYTQRAVQILLNYLKTGMFAREILSTWYEVRDLINSDQFAIILEDLLNSKNMNEIFTDIWASACDDFKYYISTCNDYQIIGKIFQSFRVKITDDEESLFTVLSDINADVKKNISKMKFFADYCNALLLNNKIPTFNRLIRTCLPLEELEHFKQEFILTSIPFRDKCSNDYLAGHVELVGNFLTESFPSRPDLVRQYKKDLLMIHDNILRSVNNFVITPSQLDAIMADCLPTNKLKKKFKERIVFSSSAIYTLQIRLADPTQYDQVRENLDYYFTSDEHKKTFKMRLITNFEKHLASMFMNCDVSFINSTLHWCLEDNQGLSEYKASLNVDIVFKELLTNAVFLRYNSYRLTGCTFRRNVELVHVETFLNWYFDTPGKVKQYKLLKIDSYLDIPVIKTLLKKKDERFLKIIMRWFFGHDHQEIEKFKKKYQGAGKILYVL